MAGDQQMRLGVAVSRAARNLHGGAVTDQEIQADFKLLAQKNGNEFEASIRNHAEKAYARPQKYLNIDKMKQSISRNMKVISENDSK